MAITVTDKDPVLAADIANEMVSFINEIYRTEFMNKLDQKIKLYENMQRDVQAQDSGQRMRFYSLLNDIKEVSQKMNENVPEFKRLNCQLLAITDQIRNNTDNYSRTFQLYRSAYGAMESYEMQTVSVIRVALPDYNNGTSKKIAAGVSVAFFSLCVFIVLFYYYLINKKLIKLIFTKSN